MFPEDPGLQEVSPEMMGFWFGTLFFQYWTSFLWLWTLVFRPRIIIDFWNRTTPHLRNGQMRSWGAEYTAFYLVLFAFYFLLNITIIYGKVIVATATTMKVMGQQQWSMAGSSPHPPIHPPPGEEGKTPVMTGIPADTTIVQKLDLKRTMPNTVMPHTGT